MENGAQVSSSQCFFPVSPACAVLVNRQIPSSSLFLSSQVQGECFEHASASGNLFCCCSSIIASSGHRDQNDRCPEDGISLQRHQLSERVLCVTEQAVRQLAVLQQAVLPSSARPRKRDVWGVLYRSLQGSAHTTDENLAAQLSTKYPCDNGWYGGNSTWSQT